jgi:hypothetical protein
LHPAERTADERAHNDRVLGPRTLGIEVTVPALAARCGLGNIDPQHGGGDDRRAAIDVCAQWPLPPDGSWLVTVRPDLDAFGGMAVFALRRAGVPLDDPMRTRIAAVAHLDRFARGPWPGPLPLPRTTAECADLFGGGGELAAVAAAVADHRRSVAERVAVTAHWLRVGEEPVAYRTALETRARTLAEALASGALRITATAGGRIAVVEGAADGAVHLGYRLAPVVVALNPAFRFRGGPPHRKFTVCQYQTGYVDLRACRDRLAMLEPGWGGSETIIGSPQGTGSKVSLAEVVTAVAAALARISRSG